MVAAVTFVTLVGAAAFRSVPGVLMDPLHEEFGWSHGTIGAAVSVNLVLFGLFSPFAAALMDRFGVRRVVANALVLVAAGSGLTVFMGEAWQLVLLWGVLVGVGTGSMSMALVATITSRWFVARRGLVSGVLTAGSATGQLIFLPIVAHLATAHGWRTASLVTAATAFAVVPLVLLLLRDHPADMGLTAYGATDADPGPPPHVRSGSSATRALSVLATASQVVDVLAARGRVRDLRDEHQRPGRHPLRARGPRPRHAHHDRRRAARGRGDLRRRRHRPLGLAHRPLGPAAAAASPTTCCAGWA